MSKKLELKVVLDLESSMVRRVPLSCLMIWEAEQNGQLAQFTWQSEAMSEQQPILTQKVSGDASPSSQLRQWTIVFTFFGLKIGSQFTDFVKNITLANRGRVEDPRKLTLLAIGEYRELHRGSWCALLLESTQ
jgi:hypothetical protein